jgi:hypothetical protein
VVLWLHDQVQSNPFIPAKFFFAVVKRLLWETRRVVPFPDDVYEAMWPGNDTLWRTLLDLNRIVMYADKDGILRDTPQRAQFHLIDGIIGGEGDGPLSPDAVHSQVLVAGKNPASVDAVGAGLMGFDAAKIPLISKAFDDRHHAWPVCTAALDSIRVRVNGCDMPIQAFLDQYHLGFAAHPNWAGHVERPALKARAVNL